MKKLLGILVLGLLFSSTPSKSAGFYTIEEYLKIYDIEDPPIKISMFNRCSGLYLLMHDLIIKKDQELAESYAERSYLFIGASKALYRIHFNKTEEDAASRAEDRVIYWNSHYDKYLAYDDGKYIDADIVTCGEMLQKYIFLKN